jgi:hypothetical protein
VDLIITGHGCTNFLTRLIKGSVSREIRKNGVIPFLDARGGTCEDQSTGRGTREWIKGWAKGRKLQPALMKP